VILAKQEAGYFTREGWTGVKLLRDAWFLVCTENLKFVIPEAAQRLSGIHNHYGEYGFRACAKRRIPE
jgi:hypothetical protein